MTLDEIKRVWIDESSVNIETTDGRVASEPFSNYRSLRDANKVQRENYQLDSFGIHWPEIDEDLSFNGFFN